jgi:hypothetical protein
VADLGAFDMRSAGGRGFRPGMGVSRSAFPELWGVEGRQEKRAAMEVHAPATVKERERRARLKEYERMKLQLAEARAASGRAGRLAAATDEGDSA